ncbi:MAG: hypothetical protein OEY93_11970 [Anaerolineae bacterium]|nr:hypothetical protein [Anaerolineae bacterium]
MITPGFFLGMVIASLIGVLFHLWMGGSIGRLVLYLFLSWIGFWLGHFVAIWLELSFLPLGTIRLGAAILGNAFMLGLGYWLGIINPEE